MKKKTNLPVSIQMPENFPRETRETVAKLPADRIEKQFSSVDLWKIEKTHRKAEDLRRLVS